MLMKLVSMSLCVVVWVFGRFFFSLKVKGEKNIPLAGPALLGANHIAWCDPAFISFVLLRYRCFFTHWLAKAELYGNWFKAFCFWALGTIKVSRGGKNRKTILKAALKAAKAALAAGEVVGVFVQGGRRPEEQSLTEGETFSGIAHLAIRAQVQVPVLPVWVGGTEQLAHPSDWRPRFRRRQWRPEITVIIGEPLTFESSQGENGRKERALAEIVAAIDELGQA
jgi:1-acyl-sn-glycerol-3-phosphate acyltransferase